jgi:hypothetical protein
LTGTRKRHEAQQEKSVPERRHPQESLFAAPPIGGTPRSPGKACEDLGLPRPAFGGHDVQPCQALCGPIPGQFRDFQIHFVRQQFGSPGGAANFSKHLKLPFLLQELAHEFWREERGTGVLSEENRIERKITNTRASGRKSNAKMGAEGTPSWYLPRLFAREGAEEFFAPAYQVP